MHRLKSNLGGGLRNLILIVMLLGALFPLYFLLVTSLKTQGGFQTDYFGLPIGDLELGNLVLAWGQVAPYLWNSFKIAGATALLVLLVVVPAAYVFSWHRFPGKERIFALMLSSLMVPAVLTIIPSYVLTRQLHLLDNAWGVIIPGVAGNVAVSVYLLRTFFQAQPVDLIEAARIDGASESRVLRSVVLPLAVPSMTTVAVLVFTGMWNGYLWPLTIISTTSKQVAAVEVTQLSGDPLLSTTPALMAGYVIVMIPLLLVFAFLLRFFVRGVTAGAVKG
ncbi:MAG: carbohydrate ABC transporter permease [Microbacteriaceae bacterium]